MTTIITKNGNGVPSSLQVGELAIDKSEPALYTNTGAGIQKLSGSAAGGGSYGAGESAPFPFVTPLTDENFKVTSSFGGSWTVDLGMMKGVDGLVLSHNNGFTLDKNNWVQVESMFNPFTFQMYRGLNLASYTTRIAFPNASMSGSTDSQQVVFDMYNVNGTGRDYTNGEFALELTAQHTSPLNAMVSLIPEKAGRASQSNYSSRADVEALFYTVQAFRVRVIPGSTFVSTSPAGGRIHIQNLLI